MPTTYDAGVRQQVYLEGLKAGKLREFQGTLAELSKDIRERLTAVEYETLDGLTKVALTKLLADLRKIVAKHYDKYAASLIAWLKAFLRVDRKLVIGVYEHFADPAKVEIARGSEGDDTNYPLAPFLWTKATNAPLPANGLPMLAFIGSLGTYAAVSVVNRVRQAYANREARQDVLAAIVGTKAARFGDGMIARQANGARAVIGTAVQHINSINEEAIGRMLFDEYEWLSVIDNATTDICRERNGNRYTYGRGPLPPAHAGCRSSVVPIIAGQRSPPKGFKAWVRQTPEKVLRDAFGAPPTGDRFEGVRPLTLDQYADKQGLILTDG